VLLFLWDASALANRYALETGSDVVDALFAEIPAAQMVATFLGYSETYSTLVRKRNRGDVALPTFHSAVSLLQAEVLVSTHFELVSVGDRDVLEGIKHIESYSLNSSDAAILSAYLRYAQADAALGSDCVFVASDQRFVQAARSEGMKTLDPEAVVKADIPTILANLSVSP
jgi:predicted nucleic acid-binding protein